MYVCAHQCMDYVLDNLWCSNSKNILYKALTTISTIFIYFLIFVHTVSTKIDKIGFAQNRSVPI
jgi:hypothetical protein